jgi:hypothetical protein
MKHRATSEFWEYYHRLPSHIRTGASDPSHNPRSNRLTI